MFVRLIRQGAFANTASLYRYFPENLIDPNTVGDLAIYGIQSHMNRQSDTNDPRLWYEAERTVENDEPQLMQWMETDAATVRVVYRTSEKMVDIYEHRHDHQAISDLPAVSKEQAGHYRRDHEMQAQVKDFSCSRLVRGMAHAATVLRWQAICVHATTDWLDDRGRLAMLRSWRFSSW